MVHAKHRGIRSKTRHKLRKHVREKGMTSVNVMLREFNKGDKVHIEINPSVHSAMPHRRFDGKTGTVIGKQGNCYLVEVKNIDANRVIIVHPAHLKLQKEILQRV